MSAAAYYAAAPNYTRAFEVGTHGLQGRMAVQCAPFFWSMARAGASDLARSGKTVVLLLLESWYLLLWQDAPSGVETAHVTINGQLLCPMVLLAISIHTVAAYATTCSFHGGHSK
jgi:hypothetical protein